MGVIGYEDFLIMEVFWKQGLMFEWKGNKGRRQRHMPRIYGHIVSE